MVLIIKILLNFCKENHGEIDILFTLVTVGKTRVLRDLSFLRNFLKNTIFETFNVSEKK